MKIRQSIFSILSLFVCFSSLFFLSCSGDNEETPVDNKAVANANKSIHSMPFNEHNVYDYAGIIHNDILAAYYQSTHLPTGTTDILERVDSIALRNREFISIIGPDYNVPEAGRIDYILTQNITCATEIIVGCDISIPAKSTLSNFVSAVLAFSATEDDYKVIYDFIVAYESDVMANILLNAHDKEVLLTVSSVARHSVYAKKKRPKKNMDPDWDFLVGNIIATTDGAQFGQAEAIIFGLVAGIAENSRK